MKLFGGAPRRARGEKAPQSHQVNVDGIHLTRTGMLLHPEVRFLYVNSQAGFTGFASLRGESDDGPEDAA